MEETVYLPLHPQCVTPVPYLMVGMALPTQWTWVWTNSGRWSWTEKPSMLQGMGSQSDTTERLTHLTSLPIVRFLKIQGIHCGWLVPLAIPMVSTAHECISFQLLRLLRPQSSWRTGPCVAGLPPRMQFPTLVTVHYAGGFDLSIYFNLLNILYFHFWAPPNQWHLILHFRGNNWFLAL